MSDDLILFKTGQTHVVAVDQETKTVTLAPIEQVLSDEAKGYLVALEWCMQQCLSGMTVQMLRKRFYNRIVELKGEGERA